MGRLRVEDGEPRLTVTVQLRGEDAERWWALAYLLGEGSSMTETARMARRAMLVWVGDLLADDDLCDRVDSLVETERSYRQRRQQEIGAIHARRLRSVK